VHIDLGDTFTFSPYNSTYGQPYKLFKHPSSGRAPPNFSTNEFCTSFGRLHFPFQCKCTIKCLVVSSCLFLY